MTREEIAKFQAVDPNYFVTDREEEQYKVVCIDCDLVADAKPDLQKLWHDVSEEPIEDTDILYEDKYGRCKSLNPYLSLWYGGIGWENTVREYEIKRWAYLSDILPK